MANSNKSVLDNIPVDDKAFPLCKETPHEGNILKELEMISSCPSCGAPIYGLRKVIQTYVAPVKYTCYCAGRELAVQNKEHS